MLFVACCDRIAIAGKGKGRSKARLDMEHTAQPKKTESKSKGLIDQVRAGAAKSKHYPKAAAAVDGYYKEVLDLQNDPILQHVVEDLATCGTAAQRPECVNANPFHVRWCWSRDFCPSATRCFCSKDRPSKKAKQEEAS